MVRNSESSRYNQNVRGMKHEQLGSQQLWPFFILLLGLPEIRRIAPRGRRSGDAWYDECCTDSHL